jgi:hypothetical protein
MKTFLLFALSGILQINSIANYQAVNSKFLSISKFDTNSNNYGAHIRLITQKSDSIRSLGLTGRFKLLNEQDDRDIASFYTN